MSKRRWLVTFQLGSNWGQEEHATLKGAKKTAREYAGRDTPTHAEVRATDYWADKSGENRTWNFDKNKAGKVEELEM